MNYTVLYYRVSTTDQKEKGYSLPSQREACRKYAQDNGFTNILEIEDDFSGTTMDRPGFSKIINLVQVNQVARIVVYTQDRLSRNAVDTLIFMDQCKQLGIELHFVDTGQARNDFDGLLTSGLKALLAHGERERIKERTLRGKMQKVLSGKPVFTRSPYGYVRNPDTHKLEIDPVRSQWVKKIFQWYVYGETDSLPLSIRGICNRLNEFGAPPESNAWQKNPATGWGQSKIHIILSNLIYAGVAHYKGIEIPVPELALIDQHTYDLAQERKKRNKELSRRNAKRMFLTSGVLYCGACGGKMAGARDYYTCSSVYRTYKKTEDCTMPYRFVQVRSVDSAVWAWLVWLLSDDKHLQEGVEKLKSRSEHDLAPKQSRLKTVERMLDQTVRKISRLLNDFSEEEDEDMRQLVKDNISQLKQEKQLLDKEYKDLNDDINSHTIDDEFVDRVFSIAHAVRGRIPNATFEDMRWLVDVLNVKATVYFNPEDPSYDRWMVVSCGFGLGEVRMNLSTAGRGGNIVTNYSTETGHNKEGSGGMHAAEVRYSTRIQLFPGKFNVRKHTHSFTTTASISKTGRVF